MTEFSIQEAAFSGFRLVRERRRLLGVWAIFSFLTSLSFSLVLVGVAGSRMMKLEALWVSGNIYSAAGMALLRSLLPFEAMVAPAALLFNAVILSAVNRVILRPEDRRVAYLAIGADEFRQMGLLLLTAAALFGAVLGLNVATIIITLLLSLVVGSAASTAGFVASIMVFPVIVWIAVRLSLASALTFDRGRIDLFGSWALTRGRFWSMFGVYLIALCLAMVVLLLTYLVVFAVLAVVGGSPFAAASSPDMSSIPAYFTGSRIVELALGACVSVLIWPVILTPASEIYRQTVGKGVAGRVRA